MEEQQKFVKKSLEDQAEASTEIQVEEKQVAEIEQGSDGKELIHLK